MNYFTKQLKLLQIKGAVRLRILNNIIRRFKHKIRIILSKFLTEILIGAVVFSYF